MNIASVAANLPSLDTEFDTLIQRALQAAGVAVVVSSETNDSTSIIRMPDGSTYEGLTFENPLEGWLYAVAHQYDVSAAMPFDLQRKYSETIDSLHTIGEAEGTGDELSTREYFARHPDSRITYVH